MYIAWARFRNAEVQMVVHVLNLNKMPLFARKQVNINVSRSAALVSACCYNCDVN